MNDYQGAIMSTGDDDTYEYSYNRRSWNKRHGRPETEGLRYDDLTDAEKEEKYVVLIEGATTGRPADPEPDFTGILSGGFERTLMEEGVGELLARESPNATGIIEADMDALEASGRPAAEAATTWVDARLAPRALSAEEVAERSNTPEAQAASALAKQAARRLIAVQVPMAYLLKTLKFGLPRSVYYDLEREEGLLPADAGLVGVLGEIAQGADGAHVTLVVESDRFRPIGPGLDIPKFTLPGDADKLRYLTYGH